MRRRPPLPCPDCGGPKDPGRGHKWCMDCRARRADARRHRRRGVRGLMLLPRYGITLGEYDAMLRAQGGVCAICGEAPPTNRMLKLAVDHDHATNEIRGLLCQRCNMALHFLENTPWLKRAKGYLADPPAGRCDPLLATPAPVLTETAAETDPDGVADAVASAIAGHVRYCGSCDVSSADAYLHVVTDADTGERAFFCADRDACGVRRAALHVAPPLSRLPEDQPAKAGS